jgi:aspartate-semialdehyde dehydrogenase
MIRKKEKYNLAIVGATGAVGQELIEILEERKFPVGELGLFASERTAGSSVSFEGKSHTVKLLGRDAFSGVDIAFFCANEAVSKEYASIAVSSGAVVIDDGNAFRMDPDVPLIVPETNRSALFTHNGIVAIPNCSTTPLVMLLKPLHDAARIKRVVVTTLQSVSGTGKRAMDELMEQVRAILSFREIEPRVYPHQIAFNCLPHIGSFDERGESSEEVKMRNETRKILGDTTIQLTATTVRVPVFRTHSESVNVELGKRIPENEARALFSAVPGVIVCDEPKKDLYPMPIDVSGKNEVYVGRIREDATVPAGLNFWLVSDNLRKGAALNSVQIAEELIRG